MDRVTTYVSDGFRPNPYYDMVCGLAEMLGEGTDVDEIYAYVCTLQEQGLDEDDIVEKVIEKYDSQLDALLDFVEQCPETPATIPQNPPPSNLYTRVEEVPILDLGSGDCSKVSRCQSLDKKVSDVNPQVNGHFTNVVALDASDADSLEREGQDRVLTSFNVLTQIPDLEAVKSHDGVHVVIDVGYLRDHVGAIKVSDNQYKTGKYTDYDHDVGGDLITEGYKGVNYYAEAKYDYSIDKVGRKYDTFEMQVKDLPYPLKSQWTPKYDGTCMLFVSNERGTCLKMRNGYGLRLRGPSMNSAIYLEKMPKVGQAEFFVLTRVLKYKGYHPFHGTRNLQLFTSKVKIRIGGVPVYSPCDPRLSGCAVDGRIYRIGDLDYRYKEKSTFDIRDIDAVKFYLENKGLCVQFEGGSQGTLCEYGYRVGLDDVITFYYVCDRHDKTSPTGLEKIFSLVTSEV